MTRFGLLGMCILIHIFIAYIPLVFLYAYDTNIGYKINFAYSQRVDLF
jgi:hypothetical protein